MRLHFKFKRNKREKKFVRVQRLDDKYRKILKDFGCEKK